jgi:multidrug efflux pump subunit AcrA (membrane-fusion protein)
VQQITPKGDPIARSYRVRIMMDANTPLQIGMTTETNIVTYEKAQALLVPASAITGGAVWIVRDGRLRLQPVVKGIIGKTDVEVTSGLSRADLVVVKPDATLTDGESVNVARADGSR